jgi:hypothetical protein
MFDVTNLKQKAEGIAVEGLVFFKEDLRMQKRNDLVLFTVNQQKKRGDFGNAVEQTETVVLIKNRIEREVLGV